MRPIHLLRRPALSAGVLVLCAALGIATASLGPQTTVPATLADFEMPGTQPGDLTEGIQPSQTCSSCHGGYDPDQEPYTRWAASMMAQSSRDPIFYAALAIAEQDVDFGGDLCLRCHTPAAWLEGRSVPTDGSALDPQLGDLDGVTCNQCHRMVDPIADGQNPTEDTSILANLSLGVPTSVGSAQYVVDPLDRRRGPFDLGTGFIYHQWLESPFHQESLMCATCHDVSNPLLLKQKDGSYQLDTLDQPHPTHDKRDEFPVERTASEWAASQFARGPIDMGGRFGGNQTEVSSCQDCHMPDTSGTACRPNLNGAFRDDLPQHDFNGANSWVLKAVRSLYPDVETGLTDASVAAALARNEAMLQAASDIDVFTRSGDLIVRVVNQVGHKLPTGYHEGRRMWINVRYFDSTDTRIDEFGSYNRNTAHLTTGDTKVYEGVYGLDATQAAAVGLPQGPSNHFVLNNKVYFDNRIPPRGFTNAGFEEAQSPPVAYFYPEEQYWDDTIYNVPTAAVRVEVRAYHQTTTREYIEFLRDTNVTNGDGQLAYDLWVQHGKSLPVEMDFVDIDLTAVPCATPIAYGSAKESSLGQIPRIDWNGTPSVASADFQVEVIDARPYQTGVLFFGDQSDSQPFMGGTLLLGGTIVRQQTFQLDSTGYAVIPIPITAPQVGLSRKYQALFRDPPDATGFGITNALHVDFCD